MPSFRQGLDRQLFILVSQWEPKNVLTVSELIARSKETYRCNFYRSYSCNKSHSRQCTPLRCRYRYGFRRFFSPLEHTERCWWSAFYGSCILKDRHDIKAVHNLVDKIRQGMVGIAALKLDALWSCWGGVSRASVSFFSSGCQVGNALRNRLSWRGFLRELSS